MAKKMDEKPKSNLTPESYLEQRRLVGITYTELQTAQSLHQAAVKRAKSVGIDTKAMLLVMKLRRADPDETEMFYRNVTRFAAWEGMALGTQGNLFGSTDDAKPTEKSAEEFSLHRAQDDGHHDGANGALRDANPHAAGSEENQRWDSGWLTGQRVIADEMAPKRSKGRKKASGNPEDRPPA